MRVRVLAAAAVCALLLSVAASASAASGTWERAWGKDVVSGGGTGFEICTVAANCQVGDFTGGLGGEMNSPEGAATDAAGDVYVADSDSNRIQKFDSSGNFLRAWGKDVVSGGGTGFEICTVAANCQVGDFTGGLGGEMNGPSGVATDATGNVYVADTFNYRIQKFDSSGNFLRAWGKDVDSAGGTGFEICTVAANCQTGATGGLGGEMDTPRAVAADAANNVYVADRLNSRIQKFDSSGNFLSAWGKDVDSASGTGFEICTVAANCQVGDPTGGLGGEMNLPQGIATDATNNVYVADSSINRIQKFDTSGNFLSAWGKDVDSVAAGTGFEICAVAENCQAGSPGGLGGEMDLPTGLATDTAGNLYLGDRFNNRVQRFAEPLTPASGAVPTGGAAPTGQRAAALKQCKKIAKKKHWTKKQFKKCKRKAKKLPV